MRLRLTSFAKVELFRVHRYYERKATGLGDRFLDEVQAVFRLIKKYPRAWTRLDDDIYRCRLNVFKYGVLYRVSDNECVVFVVGYLGRKPIFWRRLTKEARQTS